jgi:dienelactone hydrolase
VKRFLLAVLLGLGLVLGGTATWLAVRDPLSALPRAEGRVDAVPDSPQRDSGRLLHHYVLRASDSAPIGLTISLPDPLPERPLPVLVVLGGANTGRKNLRQVPTAGSYVLVGYDWPLPRKLPKGPDLARALPGLYARLLEVPGQVAAAIGWAAGQAWADAERISLLGFSLGALTAPAAQRVAQSNGHDIGWTVLAYGGTGLGDILAAHPKVKLGWTRPWVGVAANLLLRPLEPAEHLPWLSGRFLVIGASADQLVPRASFERFSALTPEPKTVVVLDGGHIGTGARQEARLEEVFRRTRRWLIDQGAVTPR